MYPKAYIDYLIEFHVTRDYFECHEILEEYWKETQMKDKVWVGFIQIAVGLYHERRGNEKGAYKMIKSSLSILKNQKDKIKSLGIDAKKLEKILEKKLVSIQEKEKYHDLDLPITDEKLRMECLRICDERDKKWCNPSNMDDHFLLNKHSLRKK